MPPEARAVIDVPKPQAKPAPAARCAAGTLDISIVIVNWNTRHVVQNCLESVFAHLGSLAAEVIVIDNASRDGSAEMIAERFTRAKLIVNSENQGFAKANNQGMRIARGRYVLLLNPDTVVLDDVFRKTIEYADHHPDAAVVGCQVMESSATIQRTCFRFPSPLHTLLWVSGVSAWYPKSRIAGHAAYGPWGRDSNRDVDVVSGMYMLVRREAIEHVGLMDEDYFVFAEEADWCYRFRQAGWRCVFAPVGRILHVDGGSKSTEQVSIPMYVEMQKNLLIFHRKHLGLLCWGATKFLFSVSMIVRMLWWSFWGLSRTGELSRHKALQSAAAARYHWTGVEPKL